MNHFLSSAANKILIISDVHQEVEKLDKIINSESADINLCLGDWFDSHFADSDEACERTAHYIKKFVANPKNITLFGNHDLHYFFDNKFAYCSGFENRKRDIIDSVFGNDKEEVISRFGWFQFVDEYLCTHAGLWKGFIGPMVSGPETLADYLYSQSLDCSIKLRSNQAHWFFGAGLSRGGSQKKGGLVWLDFDREFGPIDWLPQIMGHTYRKRGEIATFPKTKNYCIDTNLSQWLSVMNGQIQIKKFKDL